MPSRHSELIGSFLRRGTFPLEADYIFESEQALCDFYALEENKAILHPGLLKIVANTAGQTLYWCIASEGELVFRPLVSAQDIGELNEKLEQLRAELEQEISERKADIEAIWGTDDPTIIPEEYNSLLDLYNQVLALQKRSDEIELVLIDLNTVLNEVVGSENILTNGELVEYINTLNYKDLNTLSNFLSYFWDEDPNKRYTNLTNWAHLNEFLNDTDTTKPLNTHLYDLWVKIMGDANPNPDYDTLMKIRQNVISLLERVEDYEQDTREELDAIETAVGLHATGEYKSDPSTKYVKDATSVMDAIAILDFLIDEAIKNQRLQAIDTPSINTEIIHELDRTTIKGDVVISPDEGNIIRINQNGVIATVNLTYDKGQVALVVNGKVRDTFNLGLGTFVKSAKYDPSQESLVMVFKTTDTDQEIVIPFGNLIAEWEVDNSNASDVVELTKVRNTGIAADKLSADVRIDVSKENILQKKNNTLYVDGRSTNLTHNGEALNVFLDKATQKDLELEGKVNTNASDITSIKEINTQQGDQINNLLQTTSENTAKIVELYKLKFDFEELQAQLSDIDLGQFLVN